MSLRDTIDGARREAQENAAVLPKRKDKDEEPAEDEKRGFSKSSAAKARPSREAASSVRMETKPKSTDILGNKKETKDEKRERKRREREEEDLRNRAFDLVTRSMPGYQKTEKVFWVLLGGGLVFAIISIVVGYLFGDQSSMTELQAVISVGTLVIAYACIIAAFIYDLVKRRPFRKQAEARVRGLSDKKLAEIFEKARLEQEAEDAARAAAKAEKAAAKEAKKK